MIAGAARAVVRRSSDLPVPAAVAWAAVRRLESFLFVVRGVLTAKLPADAPTEWVAGSTVRARLRLFGVVPAGVHELTVESIDDASMTIQTRERSAVLRRWDHRLEITSLGPDSCRYSDLVELDAGGLTWLTSPLARLFFRYRHYRWKLLARRLVGG